MLTTVRRLTGNRFRLLLSTFSYLNLCLFMAEQSVILKDFRYCTQKIGRI